MFLAKKGGEVYNVGNQQGEINLIDLASLFARLPKKRVAIAKVPYLKEYPSAEPSRRCPDIAKAMKESQFFHAVDLGTGLQRMLSWREEI